MRRVPFVVLIIALAAASAQPQNRSQERPQPSSPNKGFWVYDSGVLVAAFDGKDTRIAHGANWTRQTAPSTPLFLPVAFAGAGYTLETSGSSLTMRFGDGSAVRMILPRGTPEGVGEPPYKRVITVPSSRESIC